MDAQLDGCIYTTTLHLVLCDMVKLLRKEYLATLGHIIVFSCSGSISLKEQFQLCKFVLTIVIIIIGTIRYFIPTNPQSYPSHTHHGVICIYMHLRGLSLMAFLIVWCSVNTVHIYDSFGVKHLIVP